MVAENTPLSGQPSNRMGMGSFYICPESPGDFPAIYEVNRQAFGQDGEARLVSALRDDGDYDPELSLVAVHGGRIIGHILFPPIHIVSETATTPALALAPLSVHQDYQGMGIGAALVQASWLGYQPMTCACVQMPVERDMVISNMTARTWSEGTATGA